MGSSQTRARTRVPCIGRRILNHCATREFPESALLPSQAWLAEANCCPVLGWGGSPRCGLHLGFVWGGPSCVRALDLVWASAGGQQFLAWLQVEHLTQGSASSNRAVVSNWCRCGDSEARGGSSWQLERSRMARPWVQGLAVWCRGQGPRLQSQRDWVQVLLLLFLSFLSFFLSLFLSPSLPSFFLSKYLCIYFWLHRVLVAAGRIFHCGTRASL